MFLDFLKWLFGISDLENYREKSAQPGGYKKTRVRTVGTRSIGGTCTLPHIKPVGKKSVIIGAGTEKPYWKEKHWQKWGSAYRGFFFTNQGAWKGHIEENFPGNYSFYIFHPPDALKKSNHWACFTNKGMGKYSIHFSKKPKDISSGIMEVERLISGSFKKKWRWEDVEFKIQ